MPLHDWNELAGWDGVHNIWIVELLRWIKPRLPAGYRAYIGSTPALTVGATQEKPDVAVRHWLPEPPPAPPEPAGQDAELPQPDVVAATISLDPQTAVYVATHNRMVAAVELVSPRNKDRPSSRAFYLARYLGYLHEGAHLLLVDVHRRPVGFSFADALAAEMQIKHEPLPPPLAVSYQVGEPATEGGRLIGTWRRSLVVGQPLPTIHLALSTRQVIPIDLETTYRAAAADAYLS
jgi:hypothetical protein